MRLPLDCEAIYEKEFLSQAASWEVYHHLMDKYQINQAFLNMNVPGRNFTSDFGKISFTDDINIASQRFPIQAYGQTFSWDETMKQLKSKVESYAQAQFGMCVCIYYPDGTSGVDFHADLIAFGATDCIPSLSLGAERDFILRHRHSHEQYTLTLERGSLLHMGQYCQERYEHCLPLDPQCEEGRINLTFRKVDPTQ